MAEQHKKSQFAEIEEQVLARWNKQQTFQKSLANREGAEPFSFYDGPPFANGLPHFGHSLVTSIKDSLGRYKTMRGYYVDRRNGWDCHGLPVEFAIEKQFGVSGKKQILELGLEKFNAACRESVFAYKGEWEQFFERIGRWTDTDRAYATIDRDYTESVWWVLAQINNKGLLYRGFKSMPYCPRCETPLSNFEVNEGYKDNVPDPSLYVGFKIIGQDASLLGWTTTPWSLPGNAAIAVNPEEQYVYARLTTDDGKQKTFVLAQKRLEVLKEQDYHIEREMPGSELVGLSYEPLLAIDGLEDREGSNNIYKVWGAPFVSVEDGTGVLHVAPAFGEDDLKIAEEQGIPILHSIDASGHVKSGYGVDELSGKFFKGADRAIIEKLTLQGNVYAAETFEHTYPFCYRCDTPLLYYAISTWFVRVSAIKEQLHASAESINWSPNHIKQGRFGKWLEGARDWAISRNRYWGAPMPIWVNEADDNDYIVVESIEQLKELAGDDIKVDDLHRPFIDDITFTHDGKHYRRIEEVLDCWFESGSMPVAQNHYPFANQAVFEQTFPADYIGEGLDQTRLWFYVLHVIATILFEKPAYQNVLVNGIILAADGQKLSKRLKNYPPVEDVFQQEGADTLRLYLLSNTQAVSADYMRFSRDGMRDLNRNVLGTLLNSQRFFSMYADIDGWKPPKQLDQPSPSNVLDQWILARLDETVAEVTAKADEYKLAHAINPVFALIDDTSNWYIRRSRRRFWKSEDDGDKNEAYGTLWYVLVRTCQLLAPWAPFVSDHVWAILRQGSDLPESVHLSDWPVPQPQNKASRIILEDMQKTRELITVGLSQRAAAKLKVRQPLQSVILYGLTELDDGLQEIVKDELNVKEVTLVAETPPPKDEADTASLESLVALDTTVTPELKAEGLMRDIVRHIQNTRKQAGLEVDDRIALGFASDDQELTQAFKLFQQIIMNETLATELIEDGDTSDAFSQTVRIEGHEAIVRLRKVS